MISISCGFEWGNKVWVKSEVELQWETLFQCSNAMQCNAMQCNAMQCNAMFDVHT